ncbi:hypothetical protein RQP46_009297 [Phenoliferia psychrophenolica]
MAPISSLPTELLSLIAESLYAEDRSSMSLVCKTWLDPAQRALFGEVDLLDFPPHEVETGVEIQVETGVENEARAALDEGEGLRSLRLIGNEGDVLPMLSSHKLSGLRTLDLIQVQVLLEVLIGDAADPSLLAFPFRLQSLSIHHSSIHLPILSLFQSSSETLTSLSLDMDFGTTISSSLLDCLQLVAPRLLDLTICGNLHPATDLSFISTFETLRSFTLAATKPTVETVFPDLPPSTSRLAIMTLPSRIPRLGKSIAKLLPTLPDTSALRWIDLSPINIGDFDVVRNASLVEECRKRNFTKRAYLRIIPLFTYTPVSPDPNPPYIGSLHRACIDGRWCGVSRVAFGFST